MAVLKTLIERLRDLPGIGPKSAERIAHFIVRRPREDAEALAGAITDADGRAVLRRAEEPQDDVPRVITTGALEVDPSKHEVRISGQAVVLTATEFRLLHHLVRNRGRVYTRTQLLDQVVGHDVIVVERNIDVHVSALRRKLGEEGTRIETIRGVGYRFSERA